MKLRQLVSVLIHVYLIITILMTGLGITMGFLYEKDAGRFTNSISFCESEWRRIEYVLPGLRIGCYLGTIPDEI